MFDSKQDNKESSQIILQTFLWTIVCMVKTLIISPEWKFGLLNHLTSNWIQWSAMSTEKSHKVLTEIQVSGFLQSWVAQIATIGAPPEIVTMTIVASWDQFFWKVHYSVSLKEGLNFNPSSCLFCSKACRQLILNEIV